MAYYPDQVATKEDMMNITKSLGVAPGRMSNSVDKERAAIDYETMDINETASTLHDMLTGLEAHLQIVSAQVPETETALTSSQYRGSSPLYDRLHSALELLQSANQRIAAIRERLEV